MSKLGVNLSMIFNEVPLIERFALAKQAGFDYVEIQFPYELSKQQIQQQLAQHQLKLCLINAPADTLLTGGDGLACIPQRKQDFARALQQAINYAHDLNVPYINILSGRIPTGLDRQQALACFIENLQFSINQCQAYNIQVVFEMINGDDMPRFLIQNLHDVDDVLQYVPQARLQFDCYHIAKIGEPVLERLKQYLPHIGHIQFADYPQRHEPNTGEIPFARIFEFLQNSDYSAYLCAEYRPLTSSMHSLTWKTQYFA